MSVRWRKVPAGLVKVACHRLEERIRAHVILCWLALLLIRVAENTAGQTWPAMRRELQRIAIGRIAVGIGSPHLSGRKVPQHGVHQAAALHLVPLCPGPS
jgi:hypothetical protein